MGGGGRSPREGVGPIIDGTKVGGAGGGCGIFIGGGGGTNPAGSTPRMGRAVGGATAPTLGGVGGCGCMGIPTGDPPLRAVEPVMIGPLITGPAPPESPELPELTEIMEGAVEIFLWRVAGEAGMVHVWERQERE